MKKLLLFIALALLVSCNDMHDMPHNPPQINDGKGYLYILTEGLFNMNNSRLARVDRESGESDLDFFKTVNGRGLGDTANDIKLYGSKIYIVVNVSSQIEVLDAMTGRSLAQIPLFSQSGVARQPRNIVFDGKYGYVTCFDGNLVKIDTTSFDVVGMVKCGRNPDQLTIANKKIYVSNSGGLDNPNYDNTVSVVDIASFKEIKKIDVEPNPGQIVANDDDVYLVCRGDYDQSEYTFHKIDTEIDAVIRSFPDIHPLSLTIADNKAYMYSVDFNRQDYWIKVFDCITDKLISEHFITDGTTLQTPYNISLSVETGEVFICEAYNYIVFGDVYCFDFEGKLHSKISQIGLNPSMVLYISK